MAKKPAPKGAAKLRNLKKTAAPARKAAPKPAKAAKAKAVDAKMSKKAAAAEAEAAGEVAKTARKSSKQITSSSTAEYFSKNLQQVGFSSPTKAVLTTLKEALDNALDACEDAGILPDIKVHVEKLGPGTLKNTDQVLIRVEDNGPGIDAEDVPKVFGEYLASSKFGRGRCSRGQQGIGISAATTWAMQTTAAGAKVVTKRKGAKKAFSATVDMDLKNNKGIIRDKQMIDSDKEHGTSVEFRLDGRIQLNGEGGLLNYLRGSVLLNPHMTVSYNISDTPPVTIERVSNEVPVVPDAVDPHPHTMKLGEFMAHARLFGRTRVSSWLKKGFSRINEKALEDLINEGGIKPSLLNQMVEAVSESDFKDLYAAIQKIKLLAPATNSVFSIGEDAMALSIRRIGDIDYFAVLTRKPMIVDFKPVQVEVAIARLRNPGSNVADESVQVLRFANRVPLQFDKAACAIVKAINGVNWRSYGLKQPKNALPLGPYIIAVSVVSPFIKFKNASKETIDASDELVEELRRALMQTGQRLSRYLKRENKADELEQRTQHIEQFGPILIDTLARILNAPEARKQRATEGLAKVLERDTKGIAKDLQEADKKLANYLEEKRQRLAGFFANMDAEEAAQRVALEVAEAAAQKGADVAGEVAEAAVETPIREGQKAGKGKAKPKKSGGKRVAALEEA